MKTFSFAAGVFTLVLLIADPAAGRTSAAFPFFAAGAGLHGEPPTTKKQMEQSKLAAPGVWGGDGIILNIYAKTATIEYACASGEISGRIKLDAGGNFRASGFHKAARGGPQRADDKAKGQPARFEGRISGKTMTLKVTLAESGELIGEFELKHGVTPRLRRCM